MVVTTYSYGGPPANLGTGHGHVSLVGAQLFTPARDRQGEVAIVLWLGAKLEQSHSDVALVVAGKVFRGDWSGTLVDAVGLGCAASGHDEKQLAFKAGSGQKRREEQRRDGSRPISEIRRPREMSEKSEQGPKIGGNEINLDRGWEGNLRRPIWQG
jgi:hypothetical protein